METKSKLLWNMNSLRDEYKEQKRSFDNSQTSKNLDKEIIDGIN